jgi:hypothetical protein
MRTPPAIALLVLVAAVSACEPEKPAMPSFARDVAPIFKAHCVRCHGAGGTLNAEPRDPMDARPTLCHLNIYNDEGDCSAAMPVNCRRGALICASSILSLLNAQPSAIMPPPPAELNDWEKDVIATWAKIRPPPP